MAMIGKCEKKPGFSTGKKPLQVFEHTIDQTNTPTAPVAQQRVKRSPTKSQRSLKQPLNI